MYIILIDSGTTNTRIRLVLEEDIVDVERIQVGVRNTAIEGSNAILKRKIYKGIEKILHRNNVSPKQVEYIVASGMITSNLGLYEIPHITGPATIRDFALGSKVVELENSFQIPWIFTPGFKNAVNNKELFTIEEINNYDIMRGEEIEVLGLLEVINLAGCGVVILPGSHTKYVVVSKDKSMEYCMSTLGGETIFSIQQETILSHSIGKNIIENIDENMLYKGFLAAEKYGITRTFYHIRLLEMYSSLNKNELSNYFVGAILNSDILSLRELISNKEIEWMLIGGSSPLKDAFTYLIMKTFPTIKAIKASETQMESALVIGPKLISTKIDM